MAWHMLEHDMYKMFQYVLFCKVICLKSVNHLK